MYQALYRKYRPVSFDEVVGQKVIIKTLKNEIIKDKISHAYLFAGPRGCGKTSVAKIFAKVINCKNIKNANYCGKCISCEQFPNNDTIEIDAASNNGVDEIREIRSKINFVPTYGKYKVYIIDEVHMLSTGAFNALLKTLEEPPMHAIFILATTDPHKIPMTVLSRCQRFDFKKVSTDDIIERLNFIVKAEKIKIEEEAIKEIAFIADGGMRDAISILDQAVSYASDVITVQDINDIVGMIRKDQIEQVIVDIVKKDVNKLLTFVEKCDSDGKNLIKVAEKIMYSLKEKLIENLNHKENNLFHDEESIISLIKELNTTVVEMRKSSEPKLMFDLFVIKNCSVQKGNIKETENENSKKEIVKEEKSKKIENNLDSKEVSLNANNEEMVKLIDIRINNALAGFNKKELLNFKHKINDLHSYLLNPEYSDIVSLLLDGEIKALGNNYLVFVYKVNNLEMIFNYKIMQIEHILEEIYKHKYYVIATNSENWEIIKKQFNSKSKKYTFIEEKADLLNFLLENESNSSGDIENIFGSIVEYQ